MLLLLLSLMLGFWIMRLTWQWAKERSATTIGWHSSGYGQADSLNQLGFRGKTIQRRNSSREKIILFVGDSQVEANGLPFQYMIENLVQELLNQRDTAHNYKCYSVGSGGFGQDQEFLALREYFKKYEADKVVMWLTPENDIWNNMFPTHWPVNANPKPTYWLERGEMNGPNYQWLEQYPSSSTPVWKVFLGLGKLDDKWENKLPAPYEAMAANNYHGNISGWPALGGDEAIAIEKSHYAIFLYPRSKRMTYGIRLTHLLIDSIRQISLANHSGLSMFFALNNEVTAMADTSFSVEVENKIYTFNKKMLFENMADVTNGFDAHIFRLNTEWKQISRQDNHHFNHEAQMEIAHRIVDEILRPQSLAVQ